MHLSLKSLSTLTGIAVMLFLPSLAAAREDQVIHLKRGFTVPLQLPENAATVALGNPNLVGVNTLKPNFLMINGQDTGTTSLTVIGKSNSIYQYQLVVGNDVYQLRQLIGLVDKGVTVDDVNGVIVLRGKVASTAALTRVLSVADKFVGGNGSSSIKVLSDHGGVLAGNLNGSTDFDPPLDSVISEIGALQVGGGRGGGGQGGGGQGGRGGGAGGRGINRTLPIMDAKGNLGQNLQRAGIVSLAGGKVISLIKVVKQPKVEMQLRIVAIDRNKTDKLGIDWRLDGNNISLGSLLGENVTTLPNANVIRNATGTNATGSLNIGESNLITLFPQVGQFTISTFIRALEEKGASKTLSEPLLTAVSGESTSFLVGGSLPIPVQTVVPGNVNQNAVVATNVSYIRFGLQLVVRPTVLENGKVSIVLDQSISEPNYANAFLLNGFQIPTFTSKYVTTITESDSGETWAVAGLLTEEDTKSLKSIPWLSKIPMIGFLFQNKEDTVTRNELMILVNARVIDDKNEGSTTSFDGIGNLYPENNKDNNEPITDRPINQSNFPAQQLPLPTLQSVPAPNRSGKQHKNSNQSTKANNQEQRSNVQIIKPMLNNKTETIQNGVKIIKPVTPISKTPVKTEESITPNETLIKEQETNPSPDFESKSKPQTPNNLSPNNNTEENQSHPQKQTPEAVVMNQKINESEMTPVMSKVNKTVRGKIVYYEDRGTVSDSGKSVISASAPQSPSNKLK